MLVLIILEQKKYIRMPYAKNFNQPAMSQGQYISTGGPSRNNCLPPPPSKQEFPMNLAHNQGADSCNVNFNTWQEAQAGRTFASELCWIETGTLFSLIALSPSDINRVL